MENVLEQIVHDIVHVCRPNRIIEFGEKRSMSEHIKNISLCVVIPEGDARAVRRQLHLALNTSVPVNLNVYAQEDWDDLMEDSDSYAAWIARKGQLIYEQKA